MYIFILDSTNLLYMGIAFGALFLSIIITIPVILIYKKKRDKESKSRKYIYNLNPVLIRGGAKATVL